MKNILLAATFWAGTMGFVTLAAGAPKIQFDQMVYDFGKTSQVETVTGTFKFKNAGDGILKIQQPKPSCGCTVAELKPDSLKAGESGELKFTFNLGHAKAQLEKHIAVPSNDPETPEVSLTIKADYTPLYDINPLTLAPSLPFGVNDAEQFTTITRTDGKPLNIVRLDTSKPWITAKVDPADKAGDATARISIAVKRDGAPRRFSEFVQVYTADQTNTPVSSIYLYGQLGGQISVSPEALYWSVSKETKLDDKRPEAATTKLIVIRSADGKPIELKNPQSSIKGIKVELITKDAGKSYDLIAKLSEIPETTASGNVSFETSVAAQSKIEVPVIINVFKP